MRSVADFTARLIAERDLIGAGRDRVIPPAVTVSRWSATELWERFGITRLGRLTGLDRIGIPVWVSVRPNSRTLAVCQGKGVDDEAAQASALMEAIEVATAEQFDRSFCRASKQGLQSQGRRVDDLTCLLRRGGTLPLPNTHCDWLTAYSLVDGSDVLLPAEAILLDDTRDSPYWRSTDGLASGNILTEAVMHGLCERIERDAMALWAFARPAAVQNLCVDPLSLNDTALSGLAVKIADAGILLRLFDITTDINIPVFFAVLFPGDIARSALRYLDVTSGSGCHPSPARAAVRAVTEAAQSRLTKIAAVRDDFDPRAYHDQLPEGILLYADCVPRPSAVVPLHPLGHDLDTTVAHLVAAGIRDLWVVVLADEPGVVVVKAIVPGLENPPGQRAVAAGARLVRRMMGAA